MTAWLHRGFTLIELLVAMSIAGLLLVMAMPGYTLWVLDNEIRNGAQSVAAGLRAAQAAAISRNLNVQFVLAPGGWTVQMANPPNTVLETASFAEGSRNVLVTGLDAGGAAATTISFNALGQVITGANVVRIDVTVPSVAPSRSLRVIVGETQAGLPFHGVKLCDTKFTLPDPKACP